MCPDLCAEMCPDMCTDKCADMCTDMCTGTCTGMCTDVCADMCADMYTGMCISCSTAAYWLALAVVQPVVLIVDDIHSMPCHIAPGYSRQRRWILGSQRLMLCRCVWTCVLTCIQTRIQTDS